MDNETGLGYNQPFNMSLATLQRIDQLLKQINTFTILSIHNTKYNIYIIKCLNQLHKEIYPFLKDSEKEYYNNNLKSFVTFKLKTLEYEHTIHFNKAKLEEIELWLREKLHKHGLLMAKSEDNSLALGN